MSARAAYLLGALSVFAVAAGALAWLDFGLRKGLDR